MKKLVAALLLLLAATLTAAASAETVREYVEAKGYAIADISDASDNHRKCYLMENPDTQTLGFTDGEKLYLVVGVPTLSVDYDLQAMRQLFFDMAEGFEWDISWYWPEYDSGEKMRVSYGITDSLDKTAQNTYDRDEYLEVLAGELGVSVETEEDDAGRQAALDAFKADLERMKSDIPDTFLEHWALDVTKDEFSYDNTRDLSIEYGAVIALGQYKLEVGYGYGIDAFHKFSYPIAETFDADTRTLQPYPFVSRFALAGNFIEYIRENKVNAIADLTAKLVSVDAKELHQYDILVIVDTDDGKGAYCFIINVFTDDSQFWYVEY